MKQCSDKQNDGGFHAGVGAQRHLIVPDDASGDQREMTSQQGMTLSEAYRAVAQHLAFAR